MLTAVWTPLSVSVGTLEADQRGGQGLGRQCQIGQGEQAAARRVLLLLLREPSLILILPVSTAQPHPDGRDLRAILQPEEDLENAITDSLQGEGEGEGDQTSNIDSTDVARM